MATSALNPLLLFGGSFDPVHKAHIACALAASRALHDAPVHLLPNARSPLKGQPGANNAQRLAMLKRAIAPHSSLQIARYEIDRPAPSYMEDTLRHFRQQQGDAPLVLILGADSFAHLDQWKGWQRFASLCHLLVLPRAGNFHISSAIRSAFPTADAGTLLSTPAGYRLMLDAPELAISSSYIRQAFPASPIPDTLLPPAVADYIRQHALYR